MIRAIFMTDFTEAFPHKLLRGILGYARTHQQWVVCRMPPSFKKQHGLEGVLLWALKWKADVIIAQFENTDNVDIFTEKGIIPIAQDYVRPFKNISNITSDYIRTGAIAAEFFLNNGFRHFAFYGYKDVVWSDERCNGYRSEIIKAGLGHNFYGYHKQNLEDLWFYDSEPVVEWLQSLPKPVAVFACDDNQGNKLAEICKMNGFRVPEDISILGVDNDETMCSMTDPPLSSVRLDIEKAGYQVAEMVESIMKDRSLRPYDIFIPPVKVVERSSTSLLVTEDNVVLDALKYIHQNVQKSITVSDILKKVPLSRRLLEIRFRNVTGKSIHKYIIDLRVDRFSRQILESDRQIGEIASSFYDVDYNNLCRSFRQKFGVSPKEYRRLFFRDQGRRTP